MLSNNLQAGYKYLYYKNLIEDFLNYQMTESDINERKISCLDEFHVLPNTEENISLNIDIKYNLEKIAKTNSSSSLDEYIFDLIIYMREILGRSLTPSCMIS